MAQWVGSEWVFTVNYKGPKTEEVIADLDDPEDGMLSVEDCAILQLNPIYLHLKELECKYLAVKGEYASRYHLQGFIILNQKMNIKAVKELLGCPWIHLEKRSKDSTAVKAANYVKKLETTWDAFPLLETGSLKVPCTSKDEAIARIRAHIDEHWDDIVHSCGDITWSTTPKI